MTPNDGIPPILGTRPPPPTHPDPVRAQHRMMLAFLGSLIVSGGVMLWSAYGNWPPLWGILFTSANMCAYGALAWSTARRHHNHDQVGDSCYYLGFLMTLLALIVSLRFIGSGAEPHGQAPLVGRFGISLVTTVIGLAFRILLNQFRVPVEERERATRDQTADVMGQIAIELAKTLSSLKQVRGDYSKALSGLHGEYVKTLEQIRRKAEKTIGASEAAHIKAADERVRKTNEAYERVLDIATVRLERISAIPDDLAERLSATVETIEAEFQTLRDAVADIGTAGKEQAAVQRELHGQLAQSATLFDTVATAMTAVQETGPRMADSIAALNEATTAILQARSGIEDMLGALGSLGSALEASENALLAHIEDMAALKEDATASRNASRELLDAEIEAVRGMGDAFLAQSARTRDSLQKELDAVARAREALHEENEQALETMKTAFVTMAGTISLFSDFVQEHATALGKT